MKLTYELSEEVFLNYHLFATFNSKKTRTAFYKSYFIFVGSGLFTFFILANGRIRFNALIVGAVMLAVFALQLINFRWSRKKQLASFVKESLSERIEMPVTVEINAESIKYENKLASGEFNWESVKSCDELPSHFYLNISTTGAFIIPKINDSYISEIKTILESKSIEIKDYTNWKWSYFELL